MNVLHIPPTKRTPGVVYHPSKGVLKLKGNSSPENSVYFYDPLLKELSRKHYPESLKVEVSLYYFNTSSSKCLYDILKRLKLKTMNGTQVTVNWYYDVEDTDMLEIGEDYSDLLDLDFNFIEYDITNNRQQSQATIA